MLVKLNLPVYYGHLQARKSVCYNHTSRCFYELFVSKGIVLQICLLYSMFMFYLKLFFCKNICGIKYLTRFNTLSRTERRLKEGGVYSKHYDEDNTFFAYENIFRIRSYQNLQMKIVLKSRSLQILTKKYLRCVRLKVFQIIHGLFIHFFILNMVSRNYKDD